MGLTGAMTEPTGDDTTVTWAQPTESGSAFTADVLLEAAVLRTPIRGRAQVEATMAAAGDFYATLAFTHQADNGNRSYLEWAATSPAGTEINGITVLTRNAGGQIEHIAIHHRPLGALLEFNRDMARRTAGLIPPDCFGE
jgi:hypothetical protein